jgi:hypothetical protein
LIKFYHGSFAVVKREKKFFDFSTYARVLFVFAAYRGTLSSSRGMRLGTFGTVSADGNDNRRHLLIPHREILGIHCFTYRGFGIKDHEITFMTKFRGQVFPGYLRNTLVQGTSYP